MTDRTFHILNLGAGVQSTALYLMSMRQDEPEFVPRFDFAIFADTQEEPEAVYTHLRWLEKLAGCPIIERTAGRLGDNLIKGLNATGQQFISIPAFTLNPDTNKIGIIRRQCTSEYKIKVVEETIRREVLKLAKGERVQKNAVIHQYLGLSHDEPGRVAKTKGRFAVKIRPTPYLPIFGEETPDRWAIPHFPLFDMEWTRSDCQAYLKSIGATAPRSACVFCPYRQNAEWRDIRDNDPKGWARAIEIDTAIRDHDSVRNKGLVSTMFLHRSCKPLAEAPIDEPQSAAEDYAEGMSQECEGACGH